MNHPNFGAVLRRAFARLFREYGDDGGGFDVTVTANVVLRNSVTGSYGVFFGQDYGGNRDMSVIAPHRVDRLGQVAELPTNFHLQDFEEVFFRNFADSAVIVDSVVSVVYLCRRLLGNFEQDRITRGRRAQLLF